METNLENEQKEIPESICKKCGRVLSTKSNSCYYCSEVTPEQIKNLNFIMLDWQHQEASDSEFHKGEKIRKIVTLLQIIACATFIALIIVPDITERSFLKTVYHSLAIVLLFISCRIFHLNSYTIIYCALLNCTIFIFSLSLAFSSLRQHYTIASFVYGFISSLSAFIIYLIIVRIYNNKAVEL